MSLVICLGAINIYNGTVPPCQTREWCRPYKALLPRAVLFGTGSQLLYSLTSDTTLPFGSCTYVKNGFPYDMEIRCKIIKSYSFISYNCLISAIFITALSFKTTSIILVILRKTIIFAHSDAGSTASGVSFYRSYKIIFVGGNQMRQRSFFDFRLNFRYAKIRFILLIYNILHV